MRKQKAQWLVVVLLAAVEINARGDIQPGARFDQVIQELGNGYSSTRIGNTEVLSYKNGTRLRLENGVVTEITQPGQIGAARVNGSMDDSRVIQPARDEREIRQLMGPAPRRVAESAATKPAVNPTPEPTPNTPVPAKAAETESPKKSKPTGIESASTHAAANHPPLNGPQALGASGGPGAVLAHIQQSAMGLMLLLAVMALLAYVFSCYCYKRICQKAGQPPSALVWIPVVQFIPLLRVAQLPDWMLILLLVPVVNVVAMLILWARICAALNKNPWLAASLFVPVVNLILVPYLAFSATTRAEG